MVTVGSKRALAIATALAAAVSAEVTETGVPLRLEFATKLENDAAEDADGGCCCRCCCEKLSDMAETMLQFTG